jgi:lysophospholipase L1-like esterase
MTVRNGPRAVMRWQWDARHPAVMCVALLVLALSAPSAQRAAGPSSREQWVSTWATAQQLAPTQLAIGRGGPPPAAGAVNYRDQTIRMIAHVGIGARRVRVRLANSLDNPMVRIGAAHVALRESGSAIVPASDRALTFSGRTSVAIPAGAVVVSDPVDLAVPKLADVAVSLYLPDDPATPTLHRDAMHTGYLVKGDATGHARIAADSTTTSYLWLAGIDVMASADAAAIVAFGDSITDGVGATRDMDRAWPALLAAALGRGSGNPRSVLNLGIAGNRLLRPGAGVAALARFDRDVLGQDGVRWMIVLLGINDITFAAIPGMPPSEAVTSEDLIAGFMQLIARAHSHGIQVAGATIMPVEGVNTFTESGEAVRQSVNTWIRTGGAYDAVFDFDAIVRDPANPRKLRAAFDGGDHVHPNDAGNAAMAAAIDVTVFRR